MTEAKLKQLGVGKRTPSDKLFAAGDALCRTFVREGIIDIDDEQLCHQIVAVFPCEVPNCQETFSSLLEFEMHYNSRHRFICAQCRKFLPSAHFLDLHLSESHDSFFAAQAERKPMFRCFVEDCSVVSQDVAQRRTHCIETHSFPHDFRYDQSQKKSNKPSHQETNKKNNSEPMSVDLPQEMQSHKMKQFTFGTRAGKTFMKNRVDQTQDMYPHKKNQFAFGAKQGKPFTKNPKPWNFQKKKQYNKKESTSKEVPPAEEEPMDTNHTPLPETENGSSEVKQDIVAVENG